MSETLVYHDKLKWMIHEKTFWSVLVFYKSSRLEHSMVTLLELWQTGEEITIDFDSMKTC